MASKDGAGPAKKESKLSSIGGQKDLDSDEEFSDDDKLSDDTKFRRAFDTKSKHHHGGQTVPIAMGGQRVPESMGGAAAADWMSLPEVEREAVNPAEFGPEYVKIDHERNELTSLKKTVAALGPSCGAIMANTAHLARASEAKNEELVKKISELLTGEEKKRLAAVTRLREASTAILPITTEYASEIEECCVEALSLKGVQTAHTAFDSKLKKLGQAIFHQMSRMLIQLKDIKKKHTAAKKPAAPSKTGARVPITERALPASIVAAMAEAEAARTTAAATTTTTAASTTTDTASSPATPAPSS